MENLCKAALASLCAERKPNLFRQRMGTAKCCGGRVINTPDRIQIVFNCIFGSRFHEHDAAVIREYFRDMPHGAYRITKVMQAIKKADQVKTLIRNILDFGDVETDSVGDTGRYPYGPRPQAEVRDLKAKGVAFEIYEDMPGVEWDGDIATVPGLGRAAWFKDSEGNTMCIDQATSG